MKNIDLNFFPGWTRKAITFTMDDGNLTHDRTFINIVNPHGLKGSFNISSQNMTKHNDPEGMRRLYGGHEITNHVKRHPYALRDGNSLGVITDAPFDPETADKSLSYRETDDLEDGVFQRYSEKADRWGRIATAAAYIELTKRCKKELEEIFGEGSVRGFVWPFCRQENTEIIEYLKANYYGLRDAGKPAPMEDMSFALPADRTNWQYNARHANLLERAKQFEALADEGELKWLCFGVHPIDFDRDGKWNDLREFCEKYGNRPEDYWYATNIDIFEYEDAVKSVIITESSIINPSEIALCAKIDGKRVTLAPKSELNIGE